MDEITRKANLVASLQGEESANLIKEICDAVSAPITAELLKVTQGNIKLVEELRQETLLRILRLFEKRAWENFTAYSRAVARNVFLTYVRKTNSDPISMGISIDEPEEDGSPKLEIPVNSAPWLDIETAEGVERMKELLLKLPLKCRVILIFASWPLNQTESAYLLEENEKTFQGKVRKCKMLANKIILAEEAQRAVMRH